MFIITVSYYSKYSEFWIVRQKMDIKFWYIFV